jgi:hypothetical protein
MIWLLKRLSGADLTAWRKRAFISGLIIIIILALDLHRYGAWYYGYRTYLRPWSVTVLLITAFPFIKYTLAMIIQYAVRLEKFNCIFYVMVFAASLPFSFCNPDVIWNIFNWNKPWYDLRWFRSGTQLLTGIGYMFATTLGITAFTLLCEWVFDEGAAMPRLRKVLRIIFAAPE